VSDCRQSIAWPGPSLWLSPENGGESASERVQSARVHSRSLAPVPMLQGGRPTSRLGHGSASGVDAAVACLWAGANDPHRVSSHWSRSVSKPEGATIGRSV